MGDGVKLHNNIGGAAFCAGNDKFTSEFISYVKDLVLERFSKKEDFNFQEIYQELEEYIVRKCFAGQANDDPQRTALIARSALSEWRVSGNTDEDSQMGNSLIDTVLAGFINYLNEKRSGAGPDATAREFKLQNFEPRMALAQEIYAGSRWKGLSGGVDFFDHEGVAGYLRYQYRFLDINTDLLTTKATAALGALAYTTPYQDFTTLITAPSISLMAGGKFRFFDWLELRVGAELRPSVIAGFNHGALPVLPLDGGLSLGFNIYRGWSIWLALMAEYVIASEVVQDPTSATLLFNNVQETVTITSPGRNLQITGGRQDWAWGPSYFVGFGWRFPVWGDLDAKFSLLGQLNGYTDLAMYDPGVFGMVELFYSPLDDLEFKAGAGTTFASSKKFNSKKEETNYANWQEAVDNRFLYFWNPDHEKGDEILIESFDLKESDTDPEVGYGISFYDEDKYMSWDCYYIGGNKYSCTNHPRKNGVWEELDYDDVEWNYQEEVIIEKSGDEVVFASDGSVYTKWTVKDSKMHFSNHVLRAIAESANYDEFVAALKPLSWTHMDAIDAALYFLYDTYNDDALSRGVKEVDTIGQEDMFSALKKGMMGMDLKGTSVCRGFARFAARLASDHGMESYVVAIPTKEDLHAVTIARRGANEPYYVFNYGTSRAESSRRDIAGIVAEYAAGRGLPYPIVFDVYDGNGRHLGTVKTDLGKIYDKNVVVDDELMNFLNGAK